MLSPEPAGRFPDAFIGLASDFLHFLGHMQPTQLEYVFFGTAAGVSGSTGVAGTDVSVLIKVRGGALRWQGLDERIISELRALTVRVDMLCAGFYALMLPIKQVRGAKYQDPIRRDGYWMPCEAHDAGATAMTWKTVPGGKSRFASAAGRRLFHSSKPSVGATKIKLCLEWTA